jgi:hypothetical protein
MFQYCVRRLRMSEDVAFKRIRAARAARQHPVIFDALADGRLSLSAVVLLAPHLDREAAAELLAVATHRTNAEVESLLADRYPRPEVPAVIRALGPAAPLAQLAARPVAAGAPCATEPNGDPAHPAGTSVQLAARPVEDGTAPAALALAPVVGDPAHATATSGQLAARPVPESSGAPPAEERATCGVAGRRFELRCTIGEPTHDKLRLAQALLGHAVPTGDVAQVLDRALDALIERLEKRRRAATAKPPTAAPRPAKNPRTVPAAVRRAVWKRDGGRCTFVGDTGHRCESRTRLEFDHEVPVARGGRATVEGIRLRCRAHNQYAAERSFGADFMRRKREEGRLRGAVARGAPPVREAAPACEAAARASVARGPERAGPHRSIEAALGALSRPGP